MHATSSVSSLATWQVATGISIQVPTFIQVQGCSLRSQSMQIDKEKAKKEWLGYNDERCHW